MCGYGRISQSADADTKIHSLQSADAKYRYYMSI
jgi:hypothetical protein